MSCFGRTTLFIYVYMHARTYGMVYMCMCVCTYKRVPCFRKSGLEQEKDNYV